MSTLIVEVCRIEKIEDHPNADRMKIATIKGWQVCIKYDPETKKAEFNEGDLCIYFPPDSVLPKALHHDRLNASTYLKDLPKRKDGTKPESKRVAAVRIRGMASFGLIAHINPEFGDDPNWEEGTNLADHFGIIKYEQPVVHSTGACDGDKDDANSLFCGYTNMEHFANYPKCIDESTEVVISEKIHGMNSRVGMIREREDWKWMAGSHYFPRKEFVLKKSRFKLSELLESNSVTETPNIGDVILHCDKNWKVENVFKPNSDDLIIFVTNLEDRVRSDFWKPLNDDMKNMIQEIANDNPESNSIIVYGEIFGDVQDMKYGLKDSKSFRAFDIAVNNRYLDFDVQCYYFQKYNIEMVPILYRGQFSIDKLKELTSGPTVVCDAESAGYFKGREGVVVKPIKEFYSKIINGRCIVKSVSVDYLSRKGGTEYH